MVAQELSWDYQRAENTLLVLSEPGDLLICSNAHLLARYCRVPPIYPQALVLYSERPTRDAVLATPRHRHAISLVGTCWAPWMRTKKVLIAEDNRDGAESLRLVIEAWGHHPEIAFDGAQAVSLASTFKPDVVVMDINMPVMDGYKAAKLLRDAHDQVLLIAMTGAPMVETPDRAREAGFHHHFSKPIELADLRALLDSDTPERLFPGFSMRR